MTKENEFDTFSTVNPSLDRTAPTPLWQQVKSTLTDWIFQKRLASGSKLPSESELCSQFDVSRTVIREALSQMVHEGLIYRHQGKGAFVRSRREEQDFVSTTVSFSGELNEKKHTVTRLVILQKRGLPTPRIAEYLKIPETEEIVSIDRVMNVDGEPRTIVRWAMPAKHVPDLEFLSLQNKSLYDTISRQYGIKFSQADRWIEAISLSDEDAQLLNVLPGRAALKVESVATDSSNVPLEYYTLVFLTNRSRLKVSVRNHPA